MNPTLRQRIHAFMHPLGTMLTPVPLEVKRIPPPTMPSYGGKLFRSFHSPRGGAREAIAKEILLANLALRVQAYQMTAVPIQEAILTVIKRGVPTTIILDKTQQQYDFGKRCQAAGADVFDDHVVKIAHNKVILIEYSLTADSDIRPGEFRKEPCPRARVLIGGSFNHTDNAEESNAENCMMINCHLNPEAEKEFDTYAAAFEIRKGASMKWGTEHPTLGLEYEPMTLEERNEVVNG